MIKKIILILLMCFITVFLLSQPVSLQTARIISDNWIRHYYQREQIPEIINYHIRQREEIITAYIFNYKPQGFVIIAGNDAFPPILGYNTAGRFQYENMPCNMEDFFIHNYDVWMVNAVNDKLSNQDTINEWNSILNNQIIVNRSDRSVDPLLSTFWGQSGGNNGYGTYNQMCPINYNGQQAIVGCVAVAMSQVMNYWQHPQRGIGQKSYTLMNYGTIYANFGQTWYDWVNMPDSCATPASAELLFHAGVSVNMVYGTSSSVASSGLVPSRTIMYFGYHPNCHMRYRSEYDTLDQWQNLLRSQLNLGRPLFFRGSSSTAGHAFNIDGYDNDGKFHINWGWGGSNGWYYINNINYNINQGCAFNFIPDPNYNPGDTTYYTLNLDVVGSGTARVSGQIIYPPHTQQFMQGSNFTITSVAAYGWQFEKFVINGETIYIHQLYINNMNEDKNVIIYYTTSTPSTYYTLTIGKEGQGSVYLNNNVINLPYSNQFIENTTITLNGAPNIDWQFDKWTINGQIITNNIYTFNINSFTNAYVTFIESYPSEVFLAYLNVDVVQNLQVMIQWDVQNRDIINLPNAGFNLYRSDFRNGNNDSKYVKLNSNIIQFQDENGIVYFDSNVINGKTYHYKLQSIDNNGNIKQFPYITIHCVGIQPPVPPTEEITIIYFNAFNFENLGLMLNWDVNDRNLIIGDGAGFNIYKSCHSNPIPSSHYVKINSNLITINQFDTIQFIDIDVVDESSYHYKVESIDINGDIIMHNYYTFTYYYDVMGIRQNTYPNNKRFKIRVKQFKEK